MRSCRSSGSPGTPNWEPPPRGLPARKVGQSDARLDDDGPAAEAFLEAAQARMYFERVKSTVTVDETAWVLGITMGTPNEFEARSARTERLVGSPPTGTPLA
jgi:hypothetical protein